MSKDLCVIMPVYNEEESVGKVFDEWVPALEQLNIDYEVLAINDGSKDSTLEILKSYETKLAGKVRVHDQANRGHGQSCIEGYKLAIKRGFQFVLQIDSDGQCDAQYLQSFWEQREKSPVFGFRVSRADGNSRWWISRVVSLVGFLGTGTWVRDANVPYRLIRTDQLEKAIENIPPDFHLANILVSLRLRQSHFITWIPIHFRDRFGGSPSIKTFNFAEQGLRLLKQLWTS